jgi:hypothetical protein
VDPSFQLACATTNDAQHIMGWSFSLFSAIVTALLAPHRGRSAFWWFLIGGVLPWISILVLYLLSDLSAPKEMYNPATPAGPGAAPEGPWPASEPALALPQDGWFYAMRRQALGPVSLQYLRSAIRSGALSGSVPVWCSSFRDWVAPNRVPGFFG